MSDFERKKFLDNTPPDQMTKEKKEEFLRTYESREDILRCFNGVKELIEEMCGIKLSNIEGVGLRKITEACVEKAVQDGIDGVSGPYTIEPQTETFTRFLYEFYNVPANQFQTIFPPDENGRATEATRKYFEKMQDERHLI